MARFGRQFKIRPHLAKALSAGLYWWDTSYQGAWNITTPTYALDNAAAGDTTTYINVAGVGIMGSLEAFFDSTLSSFQLTSFQFTYLGSTLSTLPVWILEGSNDKSAWTTIDSGSLTFDGASHTYTNSSVTAPYRYFRLGMQATIMGNGMRLSDWRNTFTYVSGVSVSITLGSAASTNTLDTYSPTLDIDSSKTVTIASAGTYDTYAPLVQTGSTITLGSPATSNVENTYTPSIQVDSSKTVALATTANEDTYAPVVWDPAIAAPVSSTSSEDTYAPAVWDPAVAVPIASTSTENTYTPSIKVDTSITEGPAATSTEDTYTPGIEVDSSKTVGIASTSTEDTYSPSNEVDSSKTVGLVSTNVLDTYSPANEVDTTNIVGPASTSAEDTYVPSIEVDTSIVAPANITTVHIDGDTYAASIREDVSEVVPVASTANEDTYVPAIQTGSTIAATLAQMVADTFAPGIEVDTSKTVSIASTANEDTYTITVFVGAAPLADTAIAIGWGTIAPAIWAPGVVIPPRGVGQANDLSMAIPGGGGAGPNPVVITQHGVTVILGLITAPAWNAYALASVQGIRNVSIAIPPSVFIPPSTYIGGQRWSGNTFTPTVTAIQATSITVDIAPMSGNADTFAIDTDTDATIGVEAGILAEDSPNWTAVSNVNLEVTLASAAAMAGDTYDPGIQVASSIAIDIAALVLNTYLASTSLVAEKTVNIGSVASVQEDTLGPGVLTGISASPAPDPAAMTGDTFLPAETTTRNPVVNLAAAAMTLATFAPSLALGSGVTPTPGAANAFYSALLATVQAARDASYTIQELPSAGLDTLPPAVALSADVQVTLAVAAETLGATSPTVQATLSASITAALSGLTGDTFAPSVAIGTGVLVALQEAAAMIADTYASSETTTKSPKVNVSAANAQMDAPAPNVATQLGNSVAVALAQMALDTFNPSAQGLRNIIVPVDTPDIAYAALVPGTTADRSIAVSLQAATMSLAAIAQAAISLSVEVDLATADMGMDTLAPGVTKITPVPVGTGTLTMTALPISIREDAAPQVDTASAQFDTLPPVIWLVVYSWTTWPETPARPRQIGTFRNPYHLSQPPLGVTTYLWAPEAGVQYHRPISVFELLREPIA